MASPESQEKPEVEEKEVRQSEFPLMALDEKLLLEVFAQLDLASARRLGLTCRRLHRVSQDKKVNDFSSVGRLSVSVGPAGEVELRTDLRQGQLSLPVVVPRPKAAEEPDEEEEDWDREPARSLTRKPKRPGRNVHGDRFVQVLEELVGRGVAATMLEVEGDGTERWGWLLGPLLRLLPPIVGLRLRGIKSLSQDAKKSLISQADHIRLLDHDWDCEDMGHLMMAFHTQFPNHTGGSFRPGSCTVVQKPPRRVEDEEDDVMEFPEDRDRFAPIPEADNVPMTLRLGPRTLAEAAGDFRVYKLPARFSQPYYAYLDGFIRYRKGEAPEAPLQMPWMSQDLFGFKYQKFALFGSPGKEPLGLFCPWFPKASLEPGTFLRLPPLRHPAVGGDHFYNLLCGGLDEAGEPVAAAFHISSEPQQPVLVHSLPDLPEPLWGHKVAAFEVNDPNPVHVLMGGAKDAASTQLTNKALEFHSSEHPWRVPCVEVKWMALQPMAKARAHFAVGVEGNRVFVAGGLGEDGRPTEAAEFFDYPAGTWAALPDLPLAVQGPAGLVVGGRFWVCGGRGLDGEASAQLVSLDLSGAAQGQWGQWESWREGMSRPRAFHAFTTLHDGRLMVLGGEEEGRTELELYDPAADAWTTTHFTVSTQPGMSVIPK